LWRRWEEEKSELRRVRVMRKRGDRGWNKNMNRRGRRRRRKRRRMGERKRKK
jgi:hypothetical protein